MSATINTSPGSTSTATYQYVVYALSTLPGNIGTVYFLKTDSTQRLTEINGTVSTYNVRYFTQIVVIPTSAPVLYFSAAFVYTVGGSNNQPQILSSPALFMRIA
jgi:hypothetical protein